MLRALLLAAALAAGDATCDATHHDLIKGNDSCCTIDNLCDVDQGDCDYNTQCAGDLVCGVNNCAWGDGDDCCMEAQTCDATHSDLIQGNDSCCTTDNPCDVDQGDCDNNAQCAGDLLCGSDNCAWGDGDDCCAVKPHACDAGHQFIESLDCSVAELLTQDECTKAATERGLALGGAGYDFAGHWGTAGCYFYTSGTFSGRAYFGTRNDGLGVNALSEPKNRLCECEVAAAPVSIDPAMPAPVPATASYFLGTATEICPSGSVNVYLDQECREGGTAVGAASPNESYSNRGGSACGVCIIDGDKCCSETFLTLDGWAPAHECYSPVCKAIDSAIVSEATTAVLLTGTDVQANALATIANLDAAADKLDDAADNAVADAVDSVTAVLAAAGISGVSDAAQSAVDIVADIGERSVDVEDIPVASRATVVHDKIEDLNSQVQDYTAAYTTIPDLQAQLDDLLLELASLAGTRMQSTEDGGSE